VQVISATNSIFRRYTSQLVFLYSGKSDPYCFITIVKSEHVDMISSAKPDVVKINETKHLGLKIEKSLIIPKTLNPTWNQPYIM